MIKRAIPQYLFGRIICNANGPTKNCKVVRSVCTNSSELNNPTTCNRKARLQLAAAYRILDNFGLNEGVCNHLSLRCPAANGDGEIILMAPYSFHWQEITASSLVGMDFDGTVKECGTGCGETELSAAVIHTGVMNARPDVQCIMHTHSPYAAALSCLEDSRLPMIHQNCNRYYSMIAYDTTYAGPATAFEEGKRLAKVLGDKFLMVMGNHGLLSVGPNVAWSLDQAYYFERAAQVSLLAMSTGKPLKYIPDKEAQEHLKYMYQQKYADRLFNALYRMLQKQSPDFQE